jgi:hypothetical protein
MDEFAELLCTLQDSRRRRVWLLYKALECLPLERAIDLARMAEEFVLGSDSRVQIENPLPFHIRLANSSQSQTTAQNAACTLRPEVRAADGISVTTDQSKLPLSPEQRERLLDRLANGARNAELAPEFGLSPRQVQGIRISQARKAKLGRRQEPLSSQHPPESIEEVVRFLRQQDDIVVRQSDGEFLVNGRFRLGPADLVERANRMRARQRKPAFTQGREADAPRNAESKGLRAFGDDSGRLEKRSLIEG